MTISRRRPSPSRWPGCWGSEMVKIIVEREIQVFRVVALYPFGGKECLWVSRDEARALAKADKLRMSLN